MDAIARRRRSVMLAALAILGVAYAVLATRYYVASWVSLVPIMGRSGLMRWLLGPLWFAFELAPVTVVVSLLRLGIGRSALVIACYQLIMTFAVFLFAPWNFGEFTGLIVLLAWNFALQVPVWGLTQLAMMFVSRNRGQ